MKRLLFHFLVILILSACSNSGQKQNTIINSEGKADNPIEKKEFITVSGKKLIISVDKSIGASISKVTLETKNFEITNDTFDIGETDPVEDVFLADLDNNGFQEFYFTTRSAGSGSYSKIYGFASNNDKSVTPVHIPEWNGSDNESEPFFKGFQGHNTFSVINGQLYHIFPVYLPEDSNANPTGGIRKIKYILVASEAGWILKPSELIP